MGGDGGSIPRRVDLVKTSGYRYARNLGGMGYSPNLQIKISADKLTPKEISQIRWRQCALTQSALAPPIVVCRVGLLYNKESVIKYLLSKKKLPGMEHIRSVKDVKDCKLEMDPTTLSFTCPITLSTLSTSTRGVMIWPCGCIMAEKAFKQYITKDSEKAHCPSCNAEFRYYQSNRSEDGQLLTFGDVVVMAPDGTQELRVRLLLKDMKDLKGSSAAPVPLEAETPRETPRGGEKVLKADAPREVPRGGEGEKRRRIKCTDGSSDA